MKMSAGIIGILSCVLLSCGHIGETYIPLEIRVDDTFSGSLLRGYGVLVDGHTIVTTAHEVRGKRGYWAMTSTGQKLEASSWYLDEASDMAYASLAGGSPEDSEKYHTLLTTRRKHLSTGSLLTISLQNSGLYSPKTTMIIGTHGSILGYSSEGILESLTGMILFDYPITRGQSGSPIYNAHGELVDVVHVVGE